MKKTNKALSLFIHMLGDALRLSVCGLIIAGTGMVLSVQAADEAKPTLVMGLSQLNTEITTLRANLSRTMAALENVKEAAGKGGDLAKAYATFSDAFTTVEAQVEKVRQVGVSGKARAKEYWDAWQKELTAMQNAALREKAQSRYTTASKQFDKIIERVQTAKEDFAPLMADLKDINIYLKTDLSKDAVSSLSGTIWKMGGRSRSVDSKLLDVNEEINKTIKKMPKM